MRIAFIGAGNMAGALVRGLLVGEVKHSIVCADVRRERLAELAKNYAIETTSDNAEAVRGADVVVLAIKPQVFERVLPSLGAALDPKTLVVSVAAGVSTQAIERLLDTGAAQVRVVRAMPNTPALVLAGATALAAGKHASSTDVAEAEKLFNCVGKTVVLDESLIDAVTGLSGSGPAYVFLIIEALADAGVKVGLHRESAQLLAAQTVLGSAKLLLDTGEHPGRLKDMVTSPGGTAIAGLHTLEAGGMRTTLINAVETATRRAQELGGELDRKILGR